MWAIIDKGKVWPNNHMLNQWMLNSVTFITLQTVIFQVFCSKEEAIFQSTIWYEVSKSLSNNSPHMWFHHSSAWLSYQMEWSFSNAIHLFVDSWVLLQRSHKMATPGSRHFRHAWGAQKQTHVSRGLSSAHQPELLNTSCIPIDVCRMEGSTNHFPSIYVLHKQSW